MPGHFTHIYTARRVAQQLVDGGVFDFAVDGGDNTFDGLTPLLPGFDAHACGTIMQEWPHFTALGAVGPDLFFFSQDYSSGPLAAAPFQDDMIMLALATYFFLDRAKDDDWEPLLVILAEVNTTFANILRILIKLNKLWQKFLKAWNDTIGPYVEDLSKALDDLSGGVLSAFSEAISELVDGLIALVEQELLTFKDLFAWFSLKMRTGWDEQAFVWSDMLHYRRTTRMVANLITQAKDKFAADGNEREFHQYLAYAFGWACHLGTDTIAHSFVNEQAGGPFRTHWQRHHLVENQMDAWHYRQVGDGGGAPPELHDPWGSTSDYLDINNSAMAFFVALQDDSDHPELDGQERPSPLPTDAAEAKKAVDVDGDMPEWLSEGIVRALIATYHTPDDPDVEPQNYGGGPFQRVISTVFGTTESLLSDAGVDLTRPLSELIDQIAPDPPADLDVPAGYPLPWQVSTSYQIMMLFYRLSFWGGFNLEKPPQPDFVILPPQQDLDALASAPDFSGVSSGDPVEDVCNAIKSVLDWLRKEAEALGNFVGDLIKTLLSPGTYPVRWALYQAALFGWDMITTVHEVMTHLAFVYPHGEKRNADGDILLLDEIDRSVLTLGATADAAFAAALADANDPFGNLDLNPDLARGTRNPRERYPSSPSGRSRTPAATRASIADHGPTPTSRRARAPATSWARSTTPRSNSPTKPRNSRGWGSGPTPSRRYWHSGPARPRRWARRYPVRTRWVRCPTTCCSERALPSLPMSDRPTRAPHRPSCRTGSTRPTSGARRTPITVHSGIRCRCRAT